MNILLTGGTGFIGSHLRALKSKNKFRVVSRGIKDLDSISKDNFFINDLNSHVNWDGAFENIDVVIHMAAMAHDIDVEFDDSLQAYREVNTNATLKLAQSAAQSGVKRFIFLSTIGVNGLVSNSPFKHTDAPAPQEAYAISKYEAEIALKGVSKDEGMEVVIIRPPLVYGPNAPGNFGRFSTLAKKNLPLPFGLINNKRSLVGIDNLVDLIATCIDHPKASNQTFLVSDDNDVSTSQLLRTMITSVGKKPYLLPVPVGFLKLFASLLGKRSVISRISSNLQVDISHTKDTLDWEPPISFQEGIRRCFRG